MSNRPKMTFDTIDVPYTCIMKFTEPKIYNGQYGLSYMWTIEHNSIEKVFYASQGLNDILTTMDLARDQAVTIVKHTNGLQDKELRSWFSVDGKTVDDIKKEGVPTQDYAEKHHALDITSNSHEQGIAEASLDSITASLNTGASLARIEKKLDAVLESVNPHYQEEQTSGVKEEEEPPF